jgi:hypothetical protein
LHLLRFTNPFLKRLLNPLLGCMSPPPASLGQLLALFEDHPIVYTLEEPNYHSALD